jgi:hypothetical protein
MSTPPVSRVDRWFSRPAALKIAILAGAVLALPSLRLGFFADDDALIAYLDKRASFNPPWYDLYRFVPGDPKGTLALVAHGQVAWWAAPGLRLHLVRPLSSALFALDHALYGPSPLGYHLQSFAWWLAFLLAVRSLYVRILPAPTAAIGVLLFAVTDAAVYPYGWIAARHTLVAAAPAVFALTAAVRHREERWVAGRWLAPVGMIVGLAGGEMALGALAFWTSYEVFGPRRPTAWKDRLACAAWPIAIGLAYLALYSAWKGGARESGGYVDPTSTRAFVLAAAVRLPALLAAALVHLPAELATSVPATPFIVTAAAAVAMVALLWRACPLFIADEERAAMRWLVPGAFLSMFGALGGFPGSREVLVADLAWCALVAVLLRHGFRGGGRTAVVRRAVTGVLAAVHLVVAPLLGAGTLLGIAGLTQQVAALARSPAYTDGPTDRHVFIAQASDPMAFLYPLALLTREGQTDRACFSVLSAVKSDVRIARTGPSTLEIEPTSGSMLRGPFETLYRAPEIGLHPGDEVVACDGVIRVLAVDAAARPTRIRLTVTASLDSPGVRVVVWRGGALAPLRLAVGTTEIIPWTPGPTGLF